MAGLLAGGRAEAPIASPFGRRASRSRVHPGRPQDPSNTVTDLSCPDGTIASLLEGDEDPTRHILDLRLRCAPLIVTAETSGSLFLYLDLSKEVRTAPQACASCTAAPSYAFAAPIPTGQIPRRLFGGVGALINRVGIGTNAARIAKL